MSPAVRRTLALTVLGGLGLTLASPVHAVIIRHDVDDSEYVVPDADFPALVDLFQPGDCIGTLIHPSTLLTVAHCAQDLRDNQTLTVNGTEHAIEEVVLHPEWRGWLYDIALIRLDVAVEGVTPYPLYRGASELGEELIIVGRGLHGTGIEGEPGATQDTLLRRATNVITKADDHWLEVTFEEPGEDGITALEGVGASGDSGGPAFLQTKDGLLIAGLNSWGDASFPTRVGQYGAWDYSTRVSKYLEWLDSEVDTSSTGETGETGETGDTGDTGLGEDSDTGSSPLDSGEDTGGDEDGSGDSACGCATSERSGSWVGLLALVALVKRRRRSMIP
jgi:MYXO-CTERM domain-containing protein